MWNKIMWWDISFGTRILIAIAIVVAAYFLASESSVKSDFNVGDTITLKTGEYATVVRVVACSNESCYLEIHKTGVGIDWVDTTEIKGY